MSKHVIKIGAKDEYQAISYLQLLLKELKYKIKKQEKISKVMQKDQWKFTIELEEDKNIWGNGCFIVSIDGETSTGREEVED